MNDIHPTAILVGDVGLGERNVIGAHVVIHGPVVIGDDNWFGTGVVIGAPPEVRSFPHPVGSETVTQHGVRIGSRNIIREYAQIHQGWQSTTVVGDDAFIMNQVYVAHDCHLGDEVTIASSALLAGHVRVGDRANLGLGAAVHQRCYIGEGAMVGMGAVVTRDVPPFATVYGNPARVVSANEVGMRRSGMSEATVAALAGHYGSGSGDGGLEAFAETDGLERAVRSWLGRSDAGGTAPGRSDAAGTPSVGEGRLRD